MKLTFIGTGSAFTTGKGNYHSNMLLTTPKGKNLLIDCGSDARLALDELGKSFRDITDVYISHLHADHIGGLEWLAFNTKFDSSCKKPNLYLCDVFEKRLWENSLSGGLSSLETEIATLDTYFNVHAIKENSSFKWQHINFKLVRLTHITSGFANMPSFGLIFKVDGINVFITTDSQLHPDQMNEFYKEADIIFHDCETNDSRSQVHAHYSELVKLPLKIKNKMWLYHYNPTDLPNAKKDGFRGFVKKGQCFDFKNPKTLK